MLRSGTSDRDIDIEARSALLDLGQSACEYCNYKEAIEHFNNAIEIDPEYAEIYYHRACAYRELGGHDLEALLDYSKAEELEYQYDDQQMEDIKKYCAAIDAGTSRKQPRIEVTPPAPISEYPGASSTQSPALDLTQQLTPLSASERRSDANLKRPEKQHKSRRTLAPLSERPGVSSTKLRAHDQTLKPKASSTSDSQGHGTLFNRPMRGVPQPRRLESLSPPPAASAPAPAPARSLEPIRPKHR